MTTTSTTPSYELRRSRPRAASDCPVCGMPRGIGPQCFACDDTHARLALFGSPFGRLGGETLEALRQRPLDDLRELIAGRGPIPAVRVSSAQARGAAKKYCYWGAVRYRVCLTQDGAVTYRAEERASSDRRSLELAWRDADRLAARERRVRLDCTLGRLNADEAEIVLAALKELEEA